MSRLLPLRARLGQLRLRRQLVRWGLGFSALALAVLWALTAAFLVDWALEMSRLQRAVALVLCAGASVWAYLHFTRPMLQKSESLEEMALLVERQQNIDSDLVAALQFESRESARWGSPQLASAVVDYVAEFSPSLNVFEGFSYEQLVRRFSLLAGTAALLGLGLLFFPGHASAFFERLLMAGTHYPTRTRIERILVNNTPVFPFEGTPQPLRLPFGQALEFRVEGSGEIPPTGSVSLRSRRGDIRIEVPLEQQNPSEGLTPFLGAVPRLVDSLQFQVYLGDAWTDPLSIEVIPLPLVTVEARITPPAYAAAAEDQAPADPGLRQVSVIEGSRVDLQLICTNKTLKSARVSVNDETFELQPDAKEGSRWILETAGTPFERIDEPLRYEIQVEDVDGLSLERPIQGYVRLKTDRGPRIGFRVPGEHEMVLPTAQVEIQYNATDDYGLSRLRAHLQVVRQVPRPSQMTELEEEEFMSETVDDSEPRDILIVPAERQPVTTLSGSYTLDLSPLQLSKGDEIKLTLEAVDYRGTLEPQSNLSEAHVLRITDVQGILGGMLKLDEQSARQVDEIIQRELGIGDSK